LSKQKSELKFADPSVAGNPNIWFTADTHWWHRAILKPDYSGRPFRDVEEMNEVMIANWNTLVQPTDVVFHLGDFAMAGPKSATNVARRLNGRKFIVYGNHDLKQRGVPEFESLFEKIIDFGCQIKIEDAEAFQAVRRITMCHYAFRIWNKSHFGTWSLYGHSHGNLIEPENLLSMDVGVDATARRLVEPQSSRWTWNPDGRIMPDICKPEYRPISYAEVKAIMATRTWKPIDHHRRDGNADE
jgi:calcineurin-like phosphoesterase family protein